MAVERNSGAGWEWVILLILGMFLNTIGIATLSISGWYGYPLMILGLAMLLGAVLLTLSRRNPRSGTRIRNDGSAR